VFDVAILGLVSLGYSPVIDRNRAVIATRLTVSPLKPDIVLDPSELLAAVSGVWPADGGRVALNVASETLLQDLMRSEPTTNVMVEIPAFMAVDSANASAIVALHARGNALMLKGRPLAELPREVLPCFRYSIIDFTDDRRLQEASAPAGISRNIQHVQAGVRSVADMELSFSRGAAAVLGWPIDDVIVTSSNKGKPAGQTDLNTIVELIHRVDTQEPIDKLEATLKRDPTLAFKLMRYINSPAFGLSVEISSFRHAIMMLGYARLKRWLALLLATASKDVNLKPVMFAAVRRGLLMEELVRTSGDEEMRNEMFICGVFSLLDRMFKQPFEDLLKSIPVPEKVYQALVEETGPYHPFLEVVRAVEDGSPYDFRQSADNLMMSVSEINRAMLRALTAGMQLD
jgi:EAL and modified HD-GYP domain-containing signal transduction protein